tara:strand:+ start:846 stop:1676 length:831 start_codon:yes stop_codon:yes gene_type:complete
MISCFRQVLAGLLFGFGVLPVQAGLPAAGLVDGISVDLHNGVMMDFVWIEPGTFLMGSTADDPQRKGDESPQHEVTISKGFYLGKYELTQAQWVAVMGTAPWTGKRGVQAQENHPAVYISHTALQELFRRLNSGPGEPLYRLPTEAEWEYACRAGTSARWFFGDDGSRLGDHAWFLDNSLSAGLAHAQPIGSKLPNPWGLYDIYGNVWEWVQDLYSPRYQGLGSIDPIGPASGTTIVMRGGGFVNHARNVRSAKRFFHDPSLRYAAIGARLVRSRK